MFATIMIPVDLNHVGEAYRALNVATDLAKLYEADVHMVGVTQSSPTEIAPTPEAFAEKLGAFAAERSRAHGVQITPHTEISHDMTVDLDDVLTRTAKEVGADLIVMASHVPGLAEYVFASNAGYLASHAKMSVFVVR